MNDALGCDLQGDPVSSSSASCPLRAVFSGCLPFTAETSRARQVRTRTLDLSSVKGIPRIQNTARSEQEVVYVSKEKNE